MAIHHHGKAAGRCAIALLENAMGQDAASEIAVQLQQRALLGVVSHLGVGTAGEYGSARKQGQQGMAAGVHGETPGSGNSGKGRISKR